jgi:hypothetical protein
MTFARGLARRSRACRAELRSCMPRMVPTVPVAPRGAAGRLRCVRVAQVLVHDCLPPGSPALLPAFHTRPFQPTKANNTSRRPRARLRGRIKAWWLCRLEAHPQKACATTFLFFSQIIAPTAAQLVDQKLRGEVADGLDLAVVVLARAVQPVVPARVRM